MYALKVSYNGFKPSLEKPAFLALTVMQSAKWSASIQNAHRVDSRRACISYWRRLRGSAFIPGPMVVELQDFPPLGVVPKSNLHPRSVLERPELLAVFGLCSDLAGLKVCGTQRFSLIQQMGDHPRGGIQPSLLTSPCPSPWDGVCGLSLALILGSPEL